MNAFIPIDKEAGSSSFGVISALRKILKMRKIGHCGTLDPFATGLLICATGQYTRLLRFGEAKDKCYEAELLLGRQSSTGDPEGEIIAEAPVNIDPACWASLKQKVLALQELPIPQYSAVKIAGKRAYRYAREGQALQMPMRAVQILEFEVLSDPVQDRFRYHAKVSKGTYIRALSEYIAQELGTVGMTIALRRTAIAGISVDRAHSLTELAENPLATQISPQELLGHLPSVDLAADRVKAFRNGNGSHIEAPDAAEVAVFTPDKQLLGIAHISAGELLPDIVINGDEA
jgi:tRNA pseudouridine55 synthase